MNSVGLSFDRRSQESVIVLLEEKGDRHRLLQSRK